MTGVEFTAALAAELAALSNIEARLEQLGEEIRARRCELKRRYAVCTEEQELGYTNSLGEAVSMIAHEPIAFIVDREARPGKTRKYTFEYGAVMQATKRPQHH